MSINGDVKELWGIREAPPMVPSITKTLGEIPLIKDAILIAQDYYIRLYN